MKTYNKHPQWYNQPLRLTEDELNNPDLALDNFFEWYHLHEVRQILWQWVTEVISSPGSISNDPHERNNHLFFYEKMEVLVEAAWIMSRGNPAIPTQNPPVSSKASGSTNKENGRYSKPERLIEKVATSAAEVIKEVFSQVLLKDLLEYLLPTWLRVALINAECRYNDGNGREVLYEFYEQLLPFIEALHGMAGNASFDKLTTVVTGFFQQFSIEYIRRELADFLEAGIGHDGKYPDGFTPWQAWMTYNDVLCLVEAAYQLYLMQKIQTFTIGSFLESGEKSVLKMVQ
ncbi:MULTISPECIES: hypothetical protein [Niastella]|uniref:Uncharacterized protein n=1 Tax=Niastella soli TaxID=2821487 RepID=A0ABS3YZA9_9BACT|nr:hypothetical protein [Niastella soli]MBO9203267.1 hypothetical protein [Niastella soli]